MKILQKVSSIFTIILLFISLMVIPVYAFELPEENADSDVNMFLTDGAYEAIEDSVDKDESFVEQDLQLQTYQEITTQLDENLLGGAYFDDDGNLNILVKEGVKKEDVIIENVKMRASNNISFQTIKYSYNELEEYQNIIMEFIDQLGFQATGIDQKENKVVIFTDTDIDLEYLHTLVPEDTVLIEVGDYECIDTASKTVSPGTAIINNSNSTYGSITCAVAWDNSTTSKKYGFMTAGHLGNVGDSVSYGGLSMGGITIKQQSGSVDAALIQIGQTSNTFSSTNILSDGKAYTFNGGTYPQNTSIYAYGATSGAVTGKITNTSYSGTFSGISFTNLVLTDAVSQGGDSGGPVITSHSNSYSLIGAIKGTSNGKLVYVNMANIKNAFDLNVLN